MYRSHTNGELRLSHKEEMVTLAGWVQKTRDKGFMIWVDLRDRYGITQLIFDEERTPATVMEKAKSLGREFVIQVEGAVRRVLRLHQVRLGGDDAQVPHRARRAGGRRVEGVQAAHRAGRGRGRLPLGP